MENGLHRSGGSNVRPGAIAGIVLAVVTVCTLAGGAGLLCVRRRSDKEYSGQRGEHVAATRVCDAVAPVQMLLTNCSYMQMQEETSPHKATYSAPALALPLLCSGSATSRSQEAGKR
jgi:hypothetical protein